jgi:flagellar hook-associated protein 3 FlgL
MTVSNISTQYLTSALNLAVTQSQSQLAIADTEASTGQYADLGLQLGDQSGYELSLKNQNGLLQTLSNSNNIISTNLSTTQTALDSLRSDAQNALQSLIEWSPASGSTATLQTLGANALQSFIASTNTASNGQYVFGGINSSVPPIADYFSSTPSAAKTAIDQAFMTAFGVSPTDPAAASISAGSLETFLNSTFSNLFQGTSWTSAWSSASSVNTTADIAPGQTIATFANANQPGFQQLAEAYAMLSEFGGSQLSQSAQQAVATTASSLVSNALTSLTQTEAVIGTAQSQITDANKSMSSQMTILQAQIGNLDNVDQYQVATQVNALTTQIQTAYQLTAQLQQLSLAKYLPA